MASMMIHMNDAQQYVGAGASGAIFGVIGGLLYVVARNRGHLEDLSSRQLVVTILFSLYFGYTSTGVDNVAHVSGLIIGILLGFFFIGNREVGKKSLIQGMKIKEVQKK